MAKFKDYFCGNKISEYGRKHGRVDYATFAKAFDAVLNNEIMNRTWGTCGEWEQESGYIDNSERIEETEERLQEVEERLQEIADRLEVLDYPRKWTDEASQLEEEQNTLEEEHDNLETQLEQLEAEQDAQPKVFQWYIVDEAGAQLCRDYNEILYYNSELDMYLWGVTHYGTSWSYTLTDIHCEVDETANA